VVQLRGLDKRDSVLIRIWVHRRHPLAGTAAGWRSCPIRHVGHAGAGRRRGGLVAEREMMV